MKDELLDLESGYLVFRERERGLWDVSWYPRDPEDPEYPSHTIRAGSPHLPTSGGLDALVGWAYKRYSDPVRYQRAA